MALPFNISAAGKRLTVARNSREALVILAHKGDPHEFSQFNRLWMTEGIPFAFEACPMLYEAIRCWLGQMLGIHSKQIAQHIINQKLYGRQLD